MQWCVKANTFKCVCECPCAPVCAHACTVVHEIIVQILKSFEDIEDL